MLKLASNASNKIKNGIQSDALNIEWNGDYFKKVTKKIKKMTRNWLVFCLNWQQFV